jgi:hypothetical protein
VLTVLSNCIAHLHFPIGRPEHMLVLLTPRLAKPSLITNKTVHQPRLGRFPSLLQANHQGRYWSPPCTLSSVDASWLQVNRWPGCLKVQTGAIGTTAGSLIRTGPQDPGTMPIGERLFSTHGFAGYTHEFSHAAPFYSFICSLQALPSLDVIAYSSGKPRYQ